MLSQSEQLSLAVFIISVRLDFYKILAQFATPLSNMGILTFVSFLFYGYKNKANLMATPNHSTKFWKESKLPRL